MIHMFSAVRGPSAVAVALCLGAALAACSSEGGNNGTSTTDAGQTDDGTTADSGGTDAGPSDTGGNVGPIKLLINEVIAKAFPAAKLNPTGSDMLELYNAGDNELNLTGFRILDSAKKGFASGFSLPPGTKIGPKGFLIIYFNHDGAGTPVIDMGLGADEAATLWDNEGKELDKVNWEVGDAPEGGSWGRVPDGSTVFKTMTKPTPGAANEAP